MLKVVVLFFSERQVPFACFVLLWDEHRLQASECLAGCDSVREGGMNDFA